VPGASAEDSGEDADQDDDRGGEQSGAEHAAADPCFVLDVYSRRIVGWQFAAHMHIELVLDAREHSADVQLVVPSDAGSRYTSYDFTQELKDHRVLASIGSVGDAYDNATAESFVDTFESELIADRV
jgi:transposase InsO family protein